MPDSPPDPWTPLALVKTTADYLAGKGVPSPKLDAEILLCRALGLARRIDLYARFERQVAADELTRYRGWIRRRAAREPVSHILGEREFMGLGFTVTRDVLSPRPETEILVEAALARLRPPPDKRGQARLDRLEAAARDSRAEADGCLSAADGHADLDALLDAYGQGGDDEDEREMEEAAPLISAAPPPAARKAESGKRETGIGNRGARRPAAAGRPLLVLDLGTGSGCVAAAVAACVPGARVMGVDVSEAALRVARANADRLGVGARVALRQGDWWAGVKPGVKFDAILSNPPYLVEGDAEIWPEVRDYDPPAALYGGRDGLDFHRRLAGGWREWLRPGGWLLAEVGAGQAETVAGWWRESGLAEVEIIPDHAGHGRVVAGRFA